MTHTSRASGRLWICRMLITAAALALATAGLAQDAAPPPAEHAPPPATAPAAAGEHASAPAPAQHDTAAHASQPADAHGAAPGGAGDAAAEHGEEHGESLWAFLSRIANFVILAGGLVYLLRSPLGKYLGARAEQIRLDLVNAADTRRNATEELARIEDRMRQLPAEVEALKTRGLAEVRAEQVRITEAAAAERDRLLDQARREIDQQVAAARRSLKQDAAELVIGIARRRIELEITDADQGRLVDRYVAQVKTAHD